MFLYMVFDLVLLGFLGYLGFLYFEWFSWISVSIISNLFSISISKILGLCLQDSLFQGGLSFGVSGGLSLLLMIVSLNT